VEVLPGERLLVLAAERILASGDARGPVQGPIPGEIITVLTEAGAIAVGSLVPGQPAGMSCGPGQYASRAALASGFWAWPDEASRLR